jgi:hypothetical protein
VRYVCFLIHVGGVSTGRGSRVLSRRPMLTIFQGLLSELVSSSPESVPCNVVGFPPVPMCFLCRRILTT